MRVSPLLSTLVFKSPKFRCCARSPSGRLCTGLRGSWIYFVIGAGDALLILTRQGYTLCTGDIWNALQRWSGYTPATVSWYCRLLAYTSRRSLWRLERSGHNTQSTTQDTVLLRLFVQRWQNIAFMVTGGGDSALARLSSELRAYGLS